MEIDRINACKRVNYFSSRGEGTVRVMCEECGAGGGYMTEYGMEYDAPDTIFTEVKL